MSVTTYWCQKETWKTICFVTLERSLLSSRICKCCHKQIKSYRAVKNQMLFHTGENKLLILWQSIHVKWNLKEAHSLPSIMEKSHFQVSDLWILWQKPHAKWNLKEAHSLPYWRKTIFRTRICKSYDNKFMSSGILKEHIVFHAIIHSVLACG